jgi:hypothetical protein
MESCSRACRKVQAETVTTYGKEERCKLGDPHEQAFVTFCSHKIWLPNGSYGT